MIDKINRKRWFLSLAALAAWSGCAAPDKPSAAPERRPAPTTAAPAARSAPALHIESRIPVTVFRVNGGGERLRVGTCQPGLPLEPYKTDVQSWLDGDQSLVLVATPDRPDDSLRFDEQVLHCPPWEHRLEFPLAFRGSAAESGGDKVINVRFVMGDSAPAAGDERPAYYVGINNRHYRIPSESIELPLGRYALQLLTPGGARLSGVLSFDAQGVNDPVTEVSSIPVLQNLTESMVRDILEHNSDDPILLRTQVRGPGGSAPLTIAQVILGSRQSLAALTDGEPESVELYVRAPLDATLSRLDPATQQWRPSRFRLEIPTDGSGTHLRVRMPAGDGGEDSVYLYMIVKAGDGARHASASVTSGRIDLKPEIVEQILNGDVRRVSVEYSPPELGGRQRAVLYEVVIGNRAPAHVRSTE